MTEEELNRQLPLIPHGSLPNTTDCPGVLVVGLKDDTAEVICNECGTLMASLPADQVESYFQKLFETR